jgi:hypothetical protein
MAVAVMMQKIAAFLLHKSSATIDSTKKATKEYGRYGYGWYVVVGEGGSL